jgi:hypothetical protein
MGVGYIAMSMSNKIDGDMGPRSTLALQSYKSDTFLNPPTQEFF